MYESSGELPLGFWGAGNLKADGLFDECLAIRGPEEAGFVGQYCTVSLWVVPLDPSEIQSTENQQSDSIAINSRANLATLFQLINKILGGPPGTVEPKVSNATSLTSSLPSVAFCLPSSCSAADLGQAIGQLVGTSPIGNYSIVTYADEGYCFTEESKRPSFDGWDIFVM